MIGKVGTVCPILGPYIPKWVLLSFRLAKREYRKGGGKIQNQKLATRHMMMKQSMVNRLTFVNPGNALVRGAKNTQQNHCFALLCSQGSDSEMWLTRPSNQHVLCKYPLHYFFYSVIFSEKKCKNHRTKPPAAFGHYRVGQCWSLSASIL